MRRVVRLLVMPVAAVCLGCAILTGAAAARPSADDGLEPLAGLHEEVVLKGAALEVWSQRPAPVHSLERDGWLVLVQAVGTSIETVELRASGTGTEGRRARLSRPDPDIAEASAWLEEALPDGCRVLRRVTHLDGERRMTTLVAVSSSSGASLSRRLLANLQRHGFRHGQRHAPSFAGAAGSVQFLVRGREELALAISESGDKQAIVMHWGRAVR
jgi:hypothetical protein